MNKKIYVLVVVSVFLLSLCAQAYPLCIKIMNPRHHPLFITSVNKKTTYEIPPRSWREFMVLEDGDWEVHYSSGVVGFVTWNLNRELGTFITTCKGCVPEDWAGNEVKYCTFHLDENQGYGLCSYELSVVEIRKLKKLKADCPFSKNERGTQVFPLHDPFVTHKELDEADILFPKKTVVLLPGSVPLPH